MEYESNLHKQSNSAEESSTKQILSVLHNHYPHLHHYLKFSNPLQLFVATILSAQVKDDIVNALTPVLFTHYKTAKDYADADINELTKLVARVTFAKAKAKNIRETGRILHEKYHGNVPKTMDELTALPGIGRKSANAILQNAYGIVDGIVVDTHVLRVSHRLGFTDTDKNADKSEQQLMKLLPKEEWKTFPWLMKAHGRAVCKAPVPICSTCPIEKLCPKRSVTKSL